MRCSLRGRATASTRSATSFDPEYEWTFLDPSQADPKPQICHGHDELEPPIGRLAAAGVRFDLEEVLVNGERAMMTAPLHPGLDERRSWGEGELDYHVVSVRDGRLVSLRACRDRREAL